MGVDGEVERARGARAAHCMLVCARRRALTAAQIAQRDSHRCAVSVCEGIG